MTFMSVPSSATGALNDPLEDVLVRGAGSALAVIIGVEGPSYRPVGALMAVVEDGTRVGTLSSGCIEADIGRHALETLKTGEPKVLRYGRGSPFIDIRLPCGGGLDVLLLPRPDLDALRQVKLARDRRQPCTIEIDPQTGQMRVVGAGKTGMLNGVFRLRTLPELRFLVFGKGPEAGSFAALVHSAGYPNLLLSPDTETLEQGVASGCATQHMVAQSMPTDLSIDPWTAITLFFHDHDWEPPILRSALNSPAFYIGAQGSRRARDERMVELESLGATEADRARLRGPIGLIPSARDARTLAVSVLAEVLEEARLRALT